MNYACFNLFYLPSWLKNPFSPIPLHSLSPQINTCHVSSHTVNSIPLRLHRVQVFLYAPDFINANLELQTEIPIEAYEGKSIASADSLIVPSVACTAAKGGPNRQIQSVGVRALGSCVITVQWLLSGWGWCNLQRLTEARCPPPCSYLTLLQE